MSGPVKKKLCWNCDASVPLESEVCLYCGVSIASAISDDGDEEEPKIAMPPPLYGKPAPRPTAPIASQSSSIQQAPPNMQVQNNVNKKRVAPPPLRNKPPAVKVREETSEVPQEVVSIQKQPYTLLSLFLMVGGSTFFLFGLVILLFSDQGALILRWNRDQALVYLGLGCCFLLAGWRFILRLEE